MAPRRHDIFFDIGSGMGRILCSMARKSLKKCVGVELSPALCAIAGRNALRVRGRKTSIEIRCTDATKADLSDGTIFWFFNPFGPDTLQSVIANIEESLVEHPRKIKIVYYNAVHQDVLQGFRFLRQYHEFKTVNGLHATFWENT